MEESPLGDWLTGANTRVKTEPLLCDILGKGGMPLIELLCLFKDGALPTPLLFEYHHGCRHHLIFPSYSVWRQHLPVKLLFWLVVSE